jgi:hypothetical protein
MINKKEWWMPHKKPPEEGEGLGWPCNNIGVAKNVMDSMWTRLCELDPTLPLEGFHEEEPNE